MYIHCLLLLLPLGTLASPIVKNETRLQTNLAKLEKALSDFGLDNFTWPELLLEPLSQHILEVNEPVDGDSEENIITEEPESISVEEDPVVEEGNDKDLPEEITHEALLREESLEGIEEDELVSKLRVDTTEDGSETQVDDVVETEERSTEESADNGPPVIVIPNLTDLNAVLETVEKSSSELKKPQFILHHPANDDPLDPARDVYHATVVDTTRPICSFFQHSVLGEDFGESTFPRVSYVSSEALPFRVHYHPEDNLRFEAYRWPFAACNHGCELQGLAIRAIFDWELDPVNEDSPFDEETKRALTVAREICQWKNVHHHFAINDCGGSDLRKRMLVFPKFNGTSLAAEANMTDLAALTPSTLPATAALQKNVQLPSATAEQNMVAPLNVQISNGLSLSEEARSAMREIEGILGSTHSPEDLAQMFHTVIVACQIHRYSQTLSELQLSSLPQMVQDAMGQVGRVFAETQGKINVWETRDAIVRATQIYRYQQEHGG